jgi:hypothetical protein
MVYETLSQKYPMQKRADGVTQVVERLPSKCQALSLNPSTTKKKKVRGTEGFRMQTTTAFKRAIWIERLD